MKCISWNVNGLRACLKKGFMESFVKLDADIFALQETKMQPEQAILDLPGYKQYWNSAERKGYSGTAVFSRIEPLSVTYGLGIEEHDHEGRVITLELPDCYFVTVYTPNSKRGLERLALALPLLLAPLGLLPRGLGRLLERGLLLEIELLLGVLLRRLFLLGLLALAGLDLVYDRFDEMVLHLRTVPIRR